MGIGVRFTTPELVLPVLILSGEAFVIVELS